MKQEVRSKRAPLPVGPYSQAVEAGAIYCSGQIGLDPKTGALVQGIVAQTRRVFSNLDEVLRTAGLGLNDVVQTTVFMLDLAEFTEMNEEYSKHFTPPFPARTTVQVNALPKGARIAIDAIAVRR